MLETLREHGKGDQVEQAKRELPDQVDPERDSGMLDNAPSATRTPLRKEATPSGAHGR